MYKISKNQYMLLNYPVALEYYTFLAPYVANEGRSAMTYWRVVNTGHVTFSAYRSRDVYSSFAVFVAKTVKITQSVNK